MSRNKSDKSGGHISNGYGDEETKLIALKKLFRKEGLDVNEIPPDYFNFILSQTNGLVLQKKIKIKPSKKLYSQFDNFFQLWDNIDSIHEVTFLFKGRQLKFSDPYLLDIIRKSFSLYHSEQQGKSRKVIYYENHTRDIQNRRELAGVFIHKIREDAYWEILFRNKSGIVNLFIIRELLWELVNVILKNKIVKKFKSERALNILTYKVFETLEILPEVSDNAKNSFIRKHEQGKKFKRPPTIDPENINLAELNNAYRIYYNQIFKI